MFPEGANIDKFPVAGVVRVVFNGGSSYEPLIASLAIDCGVKVNILGADTRNVNGKAFGSMLLGLPEDHGEAVRAMNYLKAQKDVTVEGGPARLVSGTPSTPPWRPLWWPASWALSWALSWWRGGRTACAPRPAR